jgi:hypothetical protein
MEYLKGPVLLSDGSIGSADGCDWAIYSQVHWIVEVRNREKPPDVQGFAH